MNLFIVSTLYQLLNTINICKNDDKFKDSVLVIMDFGNDLFGKIKVDYLRTLFVDLLIGIPNMSKCHDNINKTIYCLYSLIKRNPFNISSYNKFDNVYLSGTEILSKIVAYKMGTERSNYYYIEDGIGSYTEVLNKKIKSKKDFIFKILMGRTPLQKCKGIYVYRPEKIVNNSYHIKTYQLHKIDATYKKLIENVFMVSKNYVSGSTIFFNQWRTSKEHYEFQKLLFEVICKEMDGKCILKLHPSNIEDQKQYIDDEIEIIDDNIAFEIINFYHNMNKKILVSVASTACLTPFYIYDQRPYVIFLNKIFGKRFPETIDNDSQKFYDDFKNDCACGKYIYIPESIEELVALLSELKKSFVMSNLLTVPQLFED